MNQFIELNPNDFKHSPFQLIGQQWMLITTEKDGRPNAMTASWGGFGYMWNKNVAFIVVRPQRYTHEFIEASDTFSLSFFSDRYKKDLDYFGIVSGRQEDKIAKKGFSVVHSGLTPYITESELTIICKKLFAQAFRPESFIENAMNEKWYPDNDHHTLYIAEVTQILQKK